MRIQQFYLPLRRAWGKGSKCCWSFHTSCSRCGPWRCPPSCFYSNPSEKKAVSLTAVAVQKKTKKSIKRWYVLYLCQNVITVPEKEELLIIKSGVMTFSVHCAGGVACALCAPPLPRIAFAVDQRHWIIIKFLWVIIDEVDEQKKKKNGWEVHQVLHCWVIFFPGGWKTLLYSQGHCCLFTQPPLPSSSWPLGHMQPDLHCWRGYGAKQQCIQWVEKCGYFFFFFFFVFMSINDCALTQSLSWIWQLSGHSTPAVPGLALVQLKKTIGFLHTGNIFLLGYFKRRGF